MKKINYTFVIILTVTLSLSNVLHAQVSINTNGDEPDASSMLDISSTSHGLLIPRMTLAERGNIDLTASPTALMIYQTDNSPGFYYYDGSSWTAIQGGNDSDWTVSGNNMYSAVSGNVGIGVTNPETTLEIASGNPYLTLSNTTAENTNGSRESEIRFKGKQSGGEVSTLGILKFSHDGTSDDESGLFEIKINNGNDGDVPSRMFRIDKNYGIAGGYYSAASGDYSTAFGNQTQASGLNSTSMGYGTVAASHNATAFGDLSEARGFASTAMGSETVASGGASIAMGYFSIASGNSSIAMGDSAVASGDFSIAMGDRTRASFTHSTAMGYKTIASKSTSTAMGRQTIASGDFSTAMGELSVASQRTATAMGCETHASGINSTAMGRWTTASGLNSIAMGNGTVAGGDNSTAMGCEITVLGDYSVGIALSDQNHLEVTADNVMAIIGGNVGIGAVSPSTILELASAEPYLTLRNITPEDTDFGRNAEIIFNGTQSGGEITKLGILKFSHDGTGDDENGRFEIKVNTGSSGNSPPTMFRIDENYGIAMGREITVSGYNSVGIALNDQNGLDVTENNVMAIMGGKVGIGTNNPSCPLEVSGSSELIATYGYLNSSGATGTSGPQINDYSIKASHRIMASEFNAVSDQRIKTNIKVSNSTSDLQKIVDLKVSEYNYIDRIGKGNALQKGFIAQEVEQFIPEAVHTHSDFIPDVFILATYLTKTEDIVTIELPKNHKLSQGDLIRLITPAGQLDKEVLNVVSANSFSVSMTEKPESIFVYGKKVDDFRVVNYDYIFSTGIGAIQELSNKVDELENSNNYLLSKVEQIDKLIAEIEELKSLIIQRNTLADKTVID